MNAYIDHTNLKPDATREDIIKLCEEAKKYAFASVCVNGSWVSLCKELLLGSDTKVGTVIGFPLGAMSTRTKAFEAQDAIANGVDELDMVIPIGQLKAGNYKAVLEDICAVRKVTQGHCLKVIIECCLLTREEIKKACEICVEAHADFVKTSTGFSNHGATLEDVRFMKACVHGKCKIKAAGGIRTREDTEAMIQAGADRIGSSSAVTFLS